MFTGSLSAKLEYNYLGFRGQNYGFTFNNGQALAGLFEGWRINEQTHLFKAGLNWHFMPTPVVARY
jgi:opacity protein-like surface antigen